MAVAKSAGSFFGGLFNNPTFLILGGLAVALLFFAPDIRKAFASFGESFGKIELPDITLPTINLPEINLPEITFPEFPDFSARFQSLADQISAGFAGLGTIGGTTVSPTMPPDVPTDIPPTILEDTPLGDVDVPPGVLDPSGTFESETPPTFDASQFVTEEELQARLDTRATESVSDLINATIPIPFAVANVEETQSQFQERAAAFAQAVPDIVRSTSLTDEISFGRQLSRESEDFEDILAAEARRSEAIFAGLFGNVQNPNF